MAPGGLAWTDCKSRCRGCGVVAVLHRPLLWARPNTRGSCGLFAMGKGGTAFYGTAKESRVKNRAFPSRDELKKNMDQYLRTGRHPEIKQLEQKNLEDTTWSVAPLPERDRSRPHFFIEFSVGGEPAGQLVFEMFGDVVPQIVAWAKARLAEVSPAPLLGAVCHKLVPGYGLFFAATKKQAPGLERTNRLRTTQEGVLSVSPTGDELLLSFARQPVIDQGHQPFARYVEELGGGRALISRLEGCKTDALDEPVPPIVVSRCGPCAFDGEVAGGEPTTAADAGKRVEEVAAAKREEVRAAVEAGLKRRGGAEGNEGAGPATKRAKAFGGMMAHVLGDGDSGSSSSSSSSEDEEGGVGGDAA